jgi:hypothetical protein
MGELYGDLATTENPSWRQGRFPLPIRPFGFRAQEKGNPSEAQNVQKVSRPLSKGLRHPHLISTKRQITASESCLFQNSAFGNVYCGHIGLPLKYVVYYVSREL